MSKERIQQLLNAVGTRPQTDDTSIECTDFNWNEPHYFNKGQLAKLDVFAQNVAKTLSEKFSSLCRAKFDVEITSVSLHYAGEFLTEINEGQKECYYLSFGSDPGKEFGVLEIPEQSAVLWSKQLLGDSESNEGQDKDKELSQLEQSLLYDLASVLVKALSAVHTKIESNPSNNIVSGQLPIKLDETVEICKISFAVKKTGSEVKSNASFLIPCFKMENVTGKNRYSQNESDGQDFSKIILEHLDSMSVCITAQLACSRLSFEEMMNLQADDIIMLDKQIDKPVELMVEGRTIGYGWPAKSEGQYAITVAATEF